MRTAAYIVLVVLAALFVALSLRTDHPSRMWRRRVLRLVALVVIVLALLGWL